MPENKHSAPNITFPQNPDVEIILLPGVSMPTRATDGSAGFDLQARTDRVICIRPGENEKIPLGVKLNIKNPNLVGLLMPRSGKGSSGFGFKNFIGVIDSDYQGEVIANIWNTNQKDSIVIMDKETIVQLLFVPVALVNFQQVEYFEKTARGEGGFGSTGG